MYNPDENTKRKALDNITNKVTTFSQDEIDKKRWAKFDESHWFPIQPQTNLDPVPDLPPRFVMQNVHPALALFDHRLQTATLSHEDMCTLLNPDNEKQLLILLSETGAIANKQQCKFCGGPMHFEKQGNTTYWVCNRRVNGVKCNRGKFSVRDGTVFGKSHLSIQAILWIIWHFVHHLSEQQCKQYTNIGPKNNKTVVEWYAKCRKVCSGWIWYNKPRLGGFGKIVEMDESHFAGTAKFGKGRRLGEDPWEDHFKWAFGLVERGSLDCVLKTVHSSRSRAVLLPLINESCAEGTVFCSDGWKAYVKLNENVDLEDTLHFPVNHTNNYVDPLTGAHTQTIEGLWNHAKDFLPSYGMKPKDLDSYLSAFMWFRYVKQRKLDVMKHFLLSAAHCFPPTLSVLPVANQQPILRQPRPPIDNDDEDFVEV